MRFAYGRSVASKLTLWKCDAMFDFAPILLLAIAVPVVAIVVFRNIAKTKRRSRRPVQKFNTLSNGRISR